MTQTTRRGFFQLAIGAAALVAIPAMSKPVSRVWADGRHDDTEGLQSLIHGDVVEFMDTIPHPIGWVGNTLHLYGGAYLLKSPIVLDRRMSGKTLHGGDFMIQGDVGFIVTDGASNVTLQKMHIRKV